MKIKADDMISWSNLARPSFAPSSPLARLLLAPISPLAMAIFGAARDFTSPTFAPAKPLASPSLALKKLRWHWDPLCSESHSPGNPCKGTDKLRLESSKGLDDVVLLLSDGLEAEWGGGGGGMDADCHHYQQHHVFQRHRDWFLQNNGVEFCAKAAQICVKCLSKKTHKYVFACLGVFSGTSFKVWQWSGDQM